MGAVIEESVDVAVTRQMFDSLREQQLLILARSSSSTDCRVGQHISLH